MKCKDCKWWKKLQSDDTSGECHGGYPTNSRALGVHPTARWLTTLAEEMACKDFEQQPTAEPRKRGRPRNYV